MTKSTISGKMVETREESTKRKQNWRERERERERERVLTFFVMNNLEGI